MMLLTAAVIVLLLSLRTLRQWQQTPYGRLRLREALIARISSLLDGPFDPASRDSADQATDFMLRSPRETPPANHERRAIPGRSGPISCDIYRPKDAPPEGILLWMHGGCWIMGQADHLDAEHRFIAATSRQMLVSVNYRLAPEHPYPAALHDCEDVARWLAQHGETLNAKALPLHLGGSSAGGNLAAALALELVDDETINIASLYLQCPIADLTAPERWPSYQQCADRYIPTARAMKEAIALYCPDEQQRRSGSVSPLQADDLSRLPPTLISIAATDPLRDEALAFADRLQAEGVAVQQKLFENCLHGFIGNPAALRASSELLACFLTDIKARKSK
jgi:acetyl esterase